MKLGYRWTIGVCFLMGAVQTTSARAAATAGRDLVDSADSPGAFRLAAGGATADVYVDTHDYKLANITAGLLADDIQRVTGHRPAIKSDTAQLGANAIILGTLGHCPVIDKMAADGTLHVNQIAGQWETFAWEIVDHPLANVDRALVIAGSDRRATAYGVLELSEAIGVSPWYWWADVTPAHRDNLFIRPQPMRQGPPSVKYRGFFINDEDWGLQPWAAKTFEPDRKNIGPRTYAKVFELLLRLKGNYLWPAMHPVSMDFGRIPENITLADDWGIVMGASHTEAMNRNNVLWPTEGVGPWRYDTNRANVLAYWEQWAKLRGPYEAVWTLGIRGVHDAAMEGPSDTPGRIRIVEQAIADQRDLLRKYVNPDLSKVAQLFCPYKEVLPLYQAGLKVPDDVTILWTEDNFGYIRQLSTPQEQKRSGAAGVYYHISYMGRPRSYTWLNTTPPGLIWEEMTKAYAYGADRAWVLNVGDIKPGEIGLDFWMKLGWDINSYDQKTVGQFTTDFAARQFGPTDAAAIGDVLNRYYRLGYARKPEAMDSDSFSLVNYDEARTRLSEYRKLDDDARAISDRLSPRQRDAFYELVLYPVKMCDLSSQAFLESAYARLYANQQRASAAAHLANMTHALADITAETDYFNDALQGGKWKYIMTAQGTLGTYGYKWPTSPALPAITGPARLGIAIEGRESAAATANQLPEFCPWGPKHWVDVFNTGPGNIDWKAAASDPWVVVSPASGNGSQDTRITVSIDWSKRPAGATSRSSITFSGPGGDRVLGITAINPANGPDASTPFAQVAAYVSIDADQFSRNTPQSGAQWQSIAGLGRTSDAVTVLPTTMPSVTDPAALAGKSPEIEYDFWTTSAGSAQVAAYALPTHRIHPGMGLRYAIAIDGETPTIIDCDDSAVAGGESSAQWQSAVVRDTYITTTPHQLTAPGKHTLKVWMVDPGVVLEKFVIGLGAVAPSELGPPPTLFTRSTP
jgi:hypothetical protein